MIYEDRDFAIALHPNGSLDAITPDGGQYEGPGWPDLETAKKSLLRAYVAVFHQIAKEAGGWDTTSASTPK